MVIALLAVIILAAGAFLWYQWSKTTTEPTTTNTSVTNQTVTDDVPTAPAVTTDDDLTTAEATLDQVDVNANASDETSLDAYLGEF